MFRTEKTMFRPPGDVSQAARILGKNNVWSGAPCDLDVETVGVDDREAEDEGKDEGKDQCEDDEEGEGWRREEKRRVRAVMVALQFLPLEFPWAVVQRQGLLHLSA